MNNEIKPTPLVASPKEYFDYLLAKGIHPEVAILSVMTAYEEQHGTELNLNGDVRLIKTGEWNA